ncbi:HTH-type transcriptional regulator GlnR [Collibacillus ludicampi]|jgi:MerR family glutamine synthetase transcriptional repressor|uniref:HTH-type transcriptional regulator GlnR n=1 Tax=Collibacillus ludicampi TaxID=2771369 RepID=A0AAV4LJM1_9BACL|nr:MerR family transcriptional regulator [Collibacillus ludicampi]GIM48059.1 HTH-type transcriptional regulator GlnR [Collibacillus ludicampi]
MNDEIRRNLALFPIGIVQKLTDLSARQIRYYEQHGLIRPARTEGKQRLFSFNDVERLLEIKRYIDQGLNIAGIKKMVGVAPEASQLPEADVKIGPERKERKELTEQELHDLLKKEIITRASRPGLPNSLIQGELSRFFH